MILDEEIREELKFILPGCILMGMSENQVVKYLSGQFKMRRYQRLVSFTDIHKRKFRNKNRNNVRFKIEWKRYSAKVRLNHIQETDHN